MVKRNIVQKSVQPTLHPINSSLQQLAHAAAKDK